MLQLVEPPIINQKLYNIDKGNLIAKFPPLKHREPGYTPIWTLVMATEVPNAKIKDWLDVRWGVTIIVEKKYFQDNRNEETLALGGVDLPVYTQLHTEPVDQVPKLPGYSLPRISGSNGTNIAHYMPRQGTGWIQVKRVPVWVLVFLCPESGAVKWTKNNPQCVAVPSGNYNYTQVAIHRE